MGVRKVIIQLFLFCVILRAAHPNDDKKTALHSNACSAKFGVKGLTAAQTDRGLKDQDFRSIVHTYGNPPAVYSTGGPYGAAPENIPLFRGVTGPDHDLESVLRFLDGDRSFELMSPTFRQAWDRARATQSIDSAYETARRETAQEITETIAASGLKEFAFDSMANSATGLSAEKKKGAIVKFTNSINIALNYAGSNFRRNLDVGRRLNPVIFDASGNGDLTLGYTGIPEPGHTHEYDFLSNVSIRHIQSIYVGLEEPNSVDVWNMPWIKITPVVRRTDGAFQSFSLEFVSVERKIPIEIYEKTNVWPEYELTNLVPRKYVGLFDLKGSIQMSSELSDSERSSLTPLFHMFTKLWKFNL